MITTVVIVVLSILSLAGGVGMSLLWAKQSREAIKLAEFRTQATQRQEALEFANAEIQELRGTAESLRDESGQHQRRIVEVEARESEARRANEEARKRMEESFAALSSKALKASNEQFLQMAREKLESQQKSGNEQLDKRKVAIEQLLKPIRESLDKCQTTTQDIEKSRKEAYGSLKTQLELMTKGQLTLQSETHKLVNALRRPEVRGRWGEIQLRRVAELAGMIEHCDFDEQTSVRTDEGHLLRPDMVVMLPSHRTIVIDSKTPLDGYLRSLEAETAEERKNCIADHTRHIEDRISELAAKQYTNQFARSPDFVVLFIPGEPFLQAAVQLKPTMIEDALKRNVVIATPSTLISLLKVVALGWQEEALAENAEKIADEGKKLHDRLGVVFGHMERMRKSLDGSVGSFNKLVASMNTRVLPQAKRFEELGVSSSKSLDDEYPTIHTLPREVPQLTNASIEHENESIELNENDV